MHEAGAVPDGEAVLESRNSCTVRILQDGFPTDAESLRRPRYSAGFIRLVA